MTLFEKAEKLKQQFFEYEKDICSGISNRIPDTVYHPKWHYEGETQQFEILTFKIINIKLEIPVLKTYLENNSWSRVFLKKFEDAMSEYSFDSKHVFLEINYPLQKLVSLNSVISHDKFTFESEKANQMLVELKDRYEARIGTFFCDNCGKRALDENKQIETYWRNHTKRTGWFCSGQCADFMDRG